MSTFGLEYNVTVFSMTGLTNTSHQLIVSVNDYPNSTFIDFDWAIYTYDSASICGKLDDLIVAQSGFDRVSFNQHNAGPFYV